MANPTANALLLVMTDVPAALEDEFNRIYDKEHIPQILGEPGFLSARRYEAIQGAPKFQALYDMENVEAYAEMTREGRPVRS